MALAVSIADDAKEETQLPCSLGDITKCPSARILKVLLERMDRSVNSSGSNAENEQQDDAQETMIEAVKSVIQEYQYSASKLLDDIHHLQYEHRLLDDDTKYDAAYDFFKDALSEKGCNVNECPFMVRHYRERGRERVVHREVGDDLVSDIMANIHCFLLHSYDINRLTKEERDQVNLESSTGICFGSLDEDDQSGDGASDDDDLSQTKKLEETNRMLTAKREKLQIHRNDSRYRDFEPEKKSSTETTDQLLDFVMMAQTVDVHENQLEEAFGEYRMDRGRLIGDLIDAVYADDATKLVIWTKLKIEDNIKEALLRGILHGYFKSTQLSTDNFLRASRLFIARKRLQIDTDAFTEVVTSNGIDGRMFDKTEVGNYEKCGNFAKRFKGVPGCKLQHVRQLYNALRKWKYVEQKEEAVVTTEDGKEDEKEPVEDDQDEHHGAGQPDVYEIGKRFYFWDLHQNHPDYVAPKYKNMKEEVLNNPLLAPLITIRAWNSLTAKIKALLATEKVSRVLGNGQSEYIYMIQMYEPLDAQHIRSLTLYTDFNDLSAKFCEILRRADPKLIAGIAHWVRNLIEMVQCFGTKLRANSSRKTYYRGVNKTFIFKMIATRFNLPISTTTSV